MKLIIYGFKRPNRNTYYFINQALERSAKQLGYETYWLDNDHQLDDVFFNNSIILTEGWETDKLPIAKNSIYIIHHFGNKIHGRYQHNQKYIDNNNKVFDLRFLCESFEDHNQVWDVKFKDLEKIDSCTYLQFNSGYNFIYQPWATDLLPHEIDENSVYIPKQNDVYYLGTITEGWHNDNIPSWKLDNKTRIDRFIKACNENKIGFTVNNPIENSLTADQYKELYQKSYLSPDIRHQHHIDVGYIPCRVFKNISYGNLGMTNSKAVFDFFDQDIAYHEDPYELFYVGQRLRTNYDKLKKMIRLVKSNHTYVNRIQSLLKCIYA